MPLCLDGPAILTCCHTSRRRIAAAAKQFPNTGVAKITAQQTSFVARRARYRHLVAHYTVIERWLIEFLYCKDITVLTQYRSDFVSGFGIIQAINYLCALLGRRAV